MSNALETREEGIPFRIDVPDAMRSITTLEDIFRINGRLFTDRPAMNFDGVARSYGEMDQRTNRFASALQALGLAPGDRIGVALKNSSYFFDTLLGARKMGAVQVAVNIRLAPVEMAFIASDSNARLFVLDAELAHHAAKLRALIGEDVRYLIAGQMDGPLPEGYEGFDSFVAGFPAEDPGYCSAPGETAVQLYTSGTTGHPKGAMLTNENLWSYFRAAMDMFPLEPFGTHLIVLPLFHVASLIWSLRALASAGHLVGLRDFDPRAVVEMIPKFGAYEFIVVPAVMQMIVNAAEPGMDFSSLRRVGYGGAILTEKLARSIIEKFGVPIHGMYGATEMSFGCTVLQIGPETLEHPALLESCGKPLPGVNLRIVDPETHVPLADCETGELWVRSPQNAKGYWNRPDDTAECFRADGWFRTGDMGHLRDGHLYLSDRLKDMIKTGGENVYPAEVERVLSAHPAVEEAVVIGVPHDKWGEAIKAIIQPVTGEHVDPADLIAFARERLAGFKCPKSVDVMKSLPRTASGKAQKNVLRKSYWKDRERKIN